MSAQGASATGIATLTSDHAVLDVWYPEPALGAASSSGHRVLSGDEVPVELLPLTGPDVDRGVERVAVRVEISDLTEPPADAYDSYLRLHLISHRLIKPLFANMDGVFGTLTNVVDNFGPCAVPGSARGPGSAPGARSPCTGSTSSPDGDAASGVRIAWTCPAGVHLAEWHDRHARGGSSTSTPTRSAPDGRGRISATSSWARTRRRRCLGHGNPVRWRHDHRDRRALPSRRQLGCRHSLGDDCVVEADCTSPPRRDRDPCRSLGNEPVKAGQLSGRDTCSSVATRSPVEAVP